MVSSSDFSVLGQDSRAGNLAQYRDRVVLVVNTATGCGLMSQYEGLQHLYEIYKDRGFFVLDFACNSFMGQAPGTAEEINHFCKTTFPRLAKVKVNDPLYVWLKDQQSGLLGKKIEWNFAKCLIDRDWSGPQPLFLKKRPRNNC